MPRRRQTTMAFISAAIIRESAVALAAPSSPKFGTSAKLSAMMLKVGLLPNLINRYPHEFSGGQCQRIGIVVS